MKIVRLPGLIDPHVHFRTPGQEYKEDFISGTKAAVAGGFTFVCDMPNNKIPITSEGLLKEKIKIASKSIFCDVGFHFGSLGDNLEEFEKVYKKVIGLKLYLNETTGNFLIDKKTLKKIFKAWPPKAGPILVHAEDDAIEAVIKEAYKDKRKVHFCHISLKSDLEQIIEAKKKNPNLSCGVTPHHLFLNENDAKRLGPYGRMKPFLKAQKDIDFFWENIDKIDIVESDHAPHTKEEKEGDSPPYGVPGLETTLPLLLKATDEKRITISDIKRLCHDNALMIFNLPNQESSVEIDMDEKYILRGEKMHTKAGWTPFEGMEVKGEIKRVILRKKIIYENGKFAGNSNGKIVNRI